MRLMLLFVAAIAAIGFLNLGPSKPKLVNTDSEMRMHGTQALRGVGMDCELVKQIAFCKYPEGIVSQFRCGPADGSPALTPGRVYRLVVDDRGPVAKWGDSPRADNNKYEKWGGDPEECPANPFEGKKKPS